MSQLPSQPQAQPSSFSPQSLSVGAAGVSIGHNMDSAILSLTHSAELAGSGSFSIDNGAQVLYT